MGNCITQMCLATATYENTTVNTFEGQTFVVKPVKIYDGDTLWVAVVTGKKYGCIPKRQRVNVRMQDYDSPELHPKTNKKDNIYLAEIAAANVAKEFLEALLRDKRVTAHFGKHDKYGRNLAELFVDGTSINKIMITTGHGVPYKGGAKTAFTGQAPFL